MTPIDTAIAKMKELEAKATPGEWEVHDGGRFGSFGDRGPSICSRNLTTDLCQPLFDLEGPADIDQCKANCGWVTAARQFVPQIIAAYEELKKENATLQEKAWKYDELCK